MKNLIVIQSEGMTVGPCADLRPVGAHQAHMEDAEAHLQGGDAHQGETNSIKDEKN